MQVKRLLKSWRSLRLRFPEREPARLPSAIATLRGCTEVIAMLAGDSSGPPIGCPSG
jgi:hypothetical protein